MNNAADQYVFQTPEGGWRVTDSRISLDSIVHAFWRGQTPEAILDDFPALTLEQIYGAIAYYLHHRQEVDRYLQAQDASWEQLRQGCERLHGSLLERIRAAQHQGTSTEEAK